LGGRLSVKQEKNDPIYNVATLLQRVKNEDLKDEKKKSSVFQATTEPQIVRKTSGRQVECWRSFLRVLKCFSCLSERRAKERKKERKKEVDCNGVCIFSEIFTSCYMYVFMSL
jgi:hypothetical protein